MIRYDPPRRRLAYGMALLAGCVDAVGFLAASGYFVSFMSGNTTRLAVDLVTRPRAALVPALLIAGFVAGVAGGALIAERAGARRKTAVLLAVAALLTGAAVAAVLGHPPAMVALSVLAMGALNNSFRRDGEVAVGVTYMTGALVRLGQIVAGRIAGQPLPGGGATLALWASLLTGAVIGALLTGIGPVLAPVAAAIGAALLALAAWRIERRAD